MSQARAEIQHDQSNHFALLLTEDSQLTRETKDTHAWPAAHLQQIHTLASQASQASLVISSAATVGFWNPVEAAMKEVYARFEA